MWESRQREALLEGRAALERTSRSLNNSERIAIETEAIGTEVIGELNMQRESLVRTQTRLTDIDTSLSRSRQLINFMKRNVFMNKILLILVIICEFGILGCVIYLKHFR